VILLPRPRQVRPLRPSPRANLAWPGLAGAVDHSLWRAGGSPFAPPAHLCYNRKSLTALPSPEHSQGDGRSGRDMIARGSSTFKVERVFLSFR